MTTTIRLATAAAAREVARPAPLRATPRTPMRLVNGDGSAEILRPGVSYLATDHPLVRRHRDRFAIVENPMTREAQIRRLRAERDRIERALRTTTKPTMTTPTTELFGPVGHRLHHVRRRRRTANPSWRLT